MFKNNKKEIFSIRKFKNGRSDSVKVGSSLLLAGLTILNSNATTIAAEINGNQLPEVVSSTDKVPADKATTFKNAAGETVFSVDAVLGQDVAEPTKANNNTGEADGTDTLNIKSEAKVNYILDEDKSNLKDSKTVEADSGTIKTPYDKKGLAYDTDGKDYRKSVVDKGGISVTEETGKEEVIKANGKAYQLQRSEVVDKDKVKYDKTTFNDIEATVSPEDMHNELGEIDYTKIKGKVYLVEETSEGQYGKFVEANNITSDAEAVQAWKNGQANAKDFTKANVTLQEGDTIIVMDRDTYATTVGKKVENKIEHPTITYTVFTDSNTNRVTYEESFTYAVNNDSFTFYADTPTYILEEGNQDNTVLGIDTFTYTTSGVETRLLNSGVDKIFGTSDDEIEDVVNKTYEYLSVKLPTEVMKQLNVRNAKLDDVLKAIKFRNYKDLNDIVNNEGISEADKSDIISYNEPVQTVINNFKDFITANNIKVAIDNNNNLVFYWSSMNANDRVLLKKILEKAHTIQFSSADVSKIKLPGTDKTFGTSDDTVYYVGRPLEKITYTDISVDSINNATTKEVIKKLKGPAYRALNFIKESVTTEANKTKVQEKETELNNVVNEIEQLMTNNNIKMGIYNDNLVFFSPDRAALDKLDEKIRNSDDIVKNINIEENNVEYLDDYEGHGSVSKTTTNHVFFDERNLNFVKETYIVYHSLNGKTSDVDYNQVIGSYRTEEKLDINDPSNSTENWNSTFSSDKTERTSTSSTGYTNGNYTGTIDKEIKNTKKEIITPVRAYKVVSDGTATVNHYYTLKTEPEELKETVETKGSVVVKYVDQNGNEIKAANTVVPETVIKTVKKYETKSDITVVSTREDVIDNPTAYSTKSVLENEIRTEDGKLYRYRAVLPTDSNLNNTTDETGNVKEGVTTVIYQYDLIIPVDPTQPKTPGNPELPQPEDKIPNDPQNRSYKDLGLVKNVERNITYVYENGPKAGQEASTPVKQEARFTRTAEINARTGEVTYKTEWTPAKKLNEVVSPTKAKYLVDKDKVEELTVDNTSENTSVVVKYRENPDVIEHDAEKDKKGTVKVKHIDAQGNVLEEETVKDNIVVATATTKVYADRDPETTYTPTNEEYSTVDKRKDVIEKDGKKYKFSKLVEATPELNNTVEETGKIKEGTTTVVYQYDYLIPVDPTKPNEGQTTPPKPTDRIPNDPQGRTYGDLGLVKSVERNITYVYENGPKAGQEANSPVKQEARFTRTALINSRTGEVTYETNWTPAQKLNEVVSPTKDKYSVDKDKVEELTVDNTSENTSVVVKYRENPDVIEHDADKDKKGTVKVKHIDDQGNVLEEETVKDNVVVAKATTKVYADRDPETTYTPTNEKYSTIDRRKESIEKNKIKYKFSKLVEVTPELNNTTEEEGTIKEGVTTVVYQYDYTIPVDPTKPEDGKTNPPSPSDKIPGDPKGRTYGDLGLVKEVERTITYVYEDGPKAGQEASTPVKQKARFTRTAEINRRTGEVTYTTDWTPAQKLNEVKSPVIPDYLVDKDKVEELTVSNTSENTNVVVKYREAVKYIEHDADKDKKGTVIVKYVDANGTVLKEVKVKENVLVAKASTKKYTDREETTYTPTNEKYSVEKEKEFTIDGIKFVFNKLVPVNAKYNNTTEENGVIKEGTTTVVYEYKPVLPSNDIVNEKPEFNGGVNPIDPPVVDIPEYKEPIGGAIVPPEVHEKSEFKGGVSPINPPVVEKPEAEVPKVETPKAEEPKKEEEPKEVIKKKEELPVTSSSSMLGMFGLVGAFGMRKKRKKDK